jgi:hypothetical protein
VPLTTMQYFVSDGAKSSNSSHCCIILLIGTVSENHSAPRSGCFGEFVIADGPALFPEMVKPVPVRCKCLRCLVGLTNALHIGTEHDSHPLEISNCGIEPPQGRGRGGSVEVTFRRVGPVG